MPEIFDVIIVGGGPAALAALASLPDNLTVALTTGASAAGSGTGRGVHSKIRAVAAERREAVGLSGHLPFEGARHGSLSRTAAAGGLANYWGQQLLRYADADPWPQSLFDDYADYAGQCAQIEDMFAWQGGDGTGGTPAPTGRYTIGAPRLLAGTKANPSAGLLAIREELMSLAGSKKVELSGAVARNWDFAGGDVTVRLEDGRTWQAPRLLLAAGVVGSLSLAMCSCPDIEDVSFSDHAPYMLYFLPALGSRALTRQEAISHFNALTLERIEDGRVRLFASVYRMSQASMALTFAALGLPAILPGMRPPRLVDLLTPIQVWTGQSAMRYEIRKHETGARLDRAPPRSDAELEAFEAWLAGEGRVLHRSQTPPGHGFHYHSASVSLDGSKFRSLPDVLMDRFGDKVVCLDASVLEQIGVRPHTLTMMAAARKAVQRLYR